MKSLNILIIGSGAVGSLENSYFKAFNALEGVHAELFDITLYNLPIKNKALKRMVYNRYTYPFHSRNLENKLLRYFKAMTAPKCDIAVIFKGMEFSRKTLDASRATHPEAVWININPDDPFNLGSIASSNQNVIDCLSFFDLYCIWSVKLKAALTARGCKKAEYLPFAYDPDVQWAENLPEGPEDCDIVFFGAWDPEREAILNTLSKYDLKIYGNNWDRARGSSPISKAISPVNIYGKDLLKTIGSAKITLNILRKQNFGSHNMRTFEIPAAGGVMLTTRSSEQEAFFPEEKASLMYTGAVELNAAVERLLGDSRLRADLRLSAHKLAEPHTYVTRARQILKYLGSR